MQKLIFVHPISDKYPKSVNPKCTLALSQALLKAMEVVWHVTPQEAERKLTAAAEMSEEEIKLAEIEISRQKLTTEERCQANRRVLRQAQQAGLHVNFCREDLYADLDDQED